MYSTSQIMYDWNKIPRPDLIKYWKLRKHEIEFQLDDLKVYQNMMEEQIVRETKKFEEEIAQSTVDFKKP